MESNENNDDVKFDMNALTGRIIEKYKTREKFATAVNMSVPTLINKLNGTVDFKSKEVFKFCNALDISLEQIPYFFYTIT